MFAAFFYPSFKIAKKKQRVDNRGGLRDPHFPAHFRIIPHNRIFPHKSALFSYFSAYSFLRLNQPHFFSTLQIYFEKSEHKISKGRKKIEFHFCGAVNLVVITAK